MLGRHLRTEIAKINAASTAEWNAIDSREDWEAFRAAKLKLLARSLSRQEFAPARQTSRSPEPFKVPDSESRIS